MCEFGRLAHHLRFAERRARKLARAIFHAMVRFGPKLERKQAVLFRGVEIGAELFAMTAACVHAHDEAERGHDAAMYRLSQQVLSGEFAWMEEGIISGWESAG